MELFAGLSAAEVDRRRREHGANIMPRPPRPSLLRRFVRQLVHFFAIMLWAAAGLALAAGVTQLAIAIIVVIVLNAVFAFAQEYRADRAAERLRSLLPVRVTVIRDGRPQVVDATDVVVGDVVQLESGDRVPADGDLARATALRLDTSLLTGESVLADLEAGERVFAGTFVAEGDGLVVIDAVGPGTRLAGISRLASQAPKPRTPLAVELGRVVRTISVIAVGIGALFFALTLLLGNPPAEGFIFGVGVTVALVPEALLPTVTLTLAWGAEQMSHRQVLVRDLESVETLGSTTIICTDKTGTLTRNEMTVVSVWTPGAIARILTPGYEPQGEVVIDGERDRVVRAAEAAVECSDGYVVEVGGTWIAHGDPMEAALDCLGRRLGLDTDRLRRPDLILQRFPFDPRRRRMSVVTGNEVLVKGAPDSVLPLCRDPGGATAAVEEMTSRGLRVLAVAVGVATGHIAVADDAERDLGLLGIVGLEDPPRADVRPSLESCRSAGIAVVVVTGDHPATASAIASEVGLRSPGDPVITGADLPDDDRALGDLVDRSGLVVARVSPEDKLRIARVLRSRGHVVAMTGDGVNDVPALHSANIGIAMGRSGTDVAREAADLVLLDDSFASIVAGIEQGRATYVNIRRFLTYHLTDNVAELTPFMVWAVSGGSIPLALGVLQVLALDIGTDTAPAVALGAEPPNRRMLSGPPVAGRLMSRTVLLRAFGILGPTEALLSMAAFLATFAAAGWRPGDAFPGGAVALAASGAAFLTVVLAQVGNAYACRSSTVWPGALGWMTNRLLLPGVAIGLTLSLASVLVPPVAATLGQALPTAVGWAFVAVAPVVLLAVDAATKRLRRSRR